MRFRLVLCSFLLISTLVPQAGSAGPAGPTEPIEAFYELRTRGIATPRNGLPYRFFLLARRDTFPKFGSSPELALTFERKKKNGATQTHRWVWILKEDWFIVDNYPAVILDTRLPTGQGFIDMKFVAENTTDKCEGTFHKSTGQLANRGRDGGLSFDTKNQFFGRVMRMRFKNATVTQDQSQCPQPDPIPCPKVSRSVSAIGSPGKSQIYFGGDLFPSEGKASIFADWIGPVPADTQPPHPGIPIHRVRAPVPSQYVNIDEDLTDGTVTGKPGTFLSGIGSMSGAPPASETGSFPCGESMEAIFFDSSATSVIGEDFKATFDGFPDRTFGAANQANFFKTELAP